MRTFEKKKFLIGYAKIVLFAIILVSSRSILLRNQLANGGKIKAEVIMRKSIRETGVIVKKIKWIQPENNIVTIGLISSVLN